MLWLQTKLKLYREKKTIERRGVNIKVLQQYNSTIHIIYIRNWEPKLDGDTGWPRLRDFDLWMEKKIIKRQPKSNDHGPTEVINHWTSGKAKSTENPYPLSKIELSSFRISFEECEIIM